MAHVHHNSFTGAVFPLEEGNTYRNNQFKDCELVYAGGRVDFDSSNNLSDCVLVIDANVADDDPNLIALIGSLGNRVNAVMRHKRADVPQPEEEARSAIEVSHHAEAKVVSDVRPIELVVDPGNLSQDDIQEVFTEIARLYRILGGDRLVFSVDGTFVVESEPA